jgi:hypothetical protein
MNSGSGSNTSFFESITTSDIIDPALDLRGFTRYDVPVEIIDFLSNVALIPAVLFCYDRYKHNRAPTAFFAAIVAASCLYHACRAGGALQCDALPMWILTDYILSQFALPTLSIMFAVHWSERKRDAVLTAWFGVHTFLFMTGLFPWISTIVAFFLLWYFYWINYRAFNWLYIWCGTGVGVIGLVLFPVSAVEWYPYMHFLWHVFSMTAVDLYVYTIVYDGQVNKPQRS